jgi:hypothetical protein
MTDHYNEAYTSYAGCNPADLHQSELFGRDTDFFTADFERGELSATIEASTQTAATLSRTPNGHHQIPPVGRPNAHCLV